jgi:predicted dehydrogenase
MDIVLCGVGGYGQTYARELLNNNKGVRWAGAVEPFPEGAANKHDIDAAGVPWFASLEDFYKNKKADLCIIASPIAFHAPQSILALRNGSHVLCEKPVAAIPAETAAMIAARDKSGKFLGIGYQWSYSDAVQKIKRDISGGLYGKSLSLRTRVLWPRDRAYYKRGSGWAGCEKDSAGRFVLDSVANNATAHYLHNMFYILGGPGRSVMPESLRAVLMRANPIQMYDTAFINIKLGGIFINYIATHAGESENYIVSRYEFENGVIIYDDRTERRFTGKLNDGTVIDYGNPAESPSCPIWKVIGSLRGDNGFAACPIEAALPHSRAMIAALLSADIGVFPDIRDDGRRFYLPGLDKICADCCDSLSLPDYNKIDWAKPGDAVRFDDKRIDLYGIK